MVLHKNNSLIMLSFVIAIITILSGLYLSSSSSLATSASTSTATVKVAASCTLTTTGGGNYSATVPNGTSSEIEGSTLSISCNDAEGFALYAVGYSNDTVGNNAMIGSSANIPSDIGSSGSYWAMKVNPTTGSTPTIENSFNNFHNVPDVHTKVASYSQSTGGSSLSVKATYKANISSSQLAGNYLGKVKYTIVHPANEIMPHEVACAGGSICYNPNTIKVVGTMGEQSITASDTSAILLASNFSREDYGFAGWSDKYDYETNPDAHFYGPQERITFTAGQYSDSNPGLSLYAVWVKSAGNLQDTTKTAELCGTNGTGGSLTIAPIDGTANLSSVSALTDQRDNETYAIARLADGNCWMIENLRLEAKYTRTAEQQALAQGYGASTTYGNFVGLPNAESTCFVSSYCGNELYDDGSNGTINIGLGGGFPGQRIPRYNNLNTQSRASNPTSNTFPNDTTTGGMYSYGNYYSWPAALANTIYYNSPTATDSNGKTSETVNTSICPFGWRLPYGRNSGNGLTAGGFYNLNYKLNNDSNVTYSTASHKMRAFPNNILYSGDFNSTPAASGRGSYGYYWSSTAYNATESYYLGLGGYGTSPSSYEDKGYGYNIRCTISL